MADFGADAAFGRVPDKLKEHYGIEMPVSTIRRTTEQHAQRIYEQEAVREIGPGTAAGVIFVGELDGSMVPVMEPAPEAEDKRKGKVLSWKEVRLNLVHPNGGVTPVFGGHFAGGVAESGRQWRRCAAKAGFGPGSHLHAVGDGAPWIANQVELQFGPQGSYLGDFFHLCEYLGAAAPVCAPDHPRAWLDRQKDRLKANQAAAVLDTLAPFVQADRDNDPVTACDRYLRNRLDQLDYQGAIQRGLPIGSGGNRERPPLHYPRTAQTPWRLVVTRSYRDNVGASAEPGQPRMGGLLARDRKRSRLHRPFHRCIALNHTPFSPMR